jgi:hypothetical protein
VRAASNEGCATCYSCHRAPVAAARTSICNSGLAAAEQFAPAGPAAPPLLRLSVPASRQIPFCQRRRDHPWLCSGARIAPAMALLLCQLCGSAAAEPMVPCDGCRALFYCSDKHRRIHAKMAHDGEECARMRGQLQRAQVRARRATPGPMRMRRCPSPRLTLVRRAVHAGALDGPPRAARGGEAIAFGDWIQGQFHGGCRPTDRAAAASRPCRAAQAPGR